MNRRRARLLRRIVVLSLLLWIFAEAVLWAGFETQRGRGLRFLFLDSRPRDVGAAREYFENRHPVLGWIVDPADFPDDVDSQLGRVCPAFPEPGDALISLYGDSFTWGTSVDNAEAWSNQLAQLIGSRVANYGVPGYGLDQAVLRYELNEFDEADWVVLTIYPNDIIRSLSRHIGLVVDASSGPRGVKPRFVLGQDGELVLEEIPFRSEEDLLAFVDDPGAFFAKDTLSPYGFWAQKNAVEFPYTWSAVRIVRSARFAAFVRRALSGEPMAYDFYQPDHPLRSMELGVALVERFRRLARERGQRVLVVVLPDPQMTSYYRRTGEWALEAFVDALGDPSTVLRMGGVFVERLGERDLREVMSDDGHYNPEGYAILAEAVYVRLAGLDASLRSVQVEEAGR